MDFFEILFGLSPDGGNGSLEFLMFAMPIAGLAVAFGVRWARRGHRRRL